MKKRHLVIVLLGLIYGVGNVAEAATASEKEQVAAILTGKELPDTEPTFVAAVRRIVELGGQLDFNAAGDLQGVDLASDRVSLTDADVPCLLALPHLTRLRLSGGGITNVGIRQVASIVGLDDIFLQDVQIDDAGLNQFTQLKNLRATDHSAQLPTDRQRVRMLETVAQASYLGLLEVGITNRGLEQLKDMPQLQALDLRGSSQIDNAGLEQLRAMKKLRTLRLGGYQINNDSMTVVAKLLPLACLTIHEAAITDAGLARLIGLPLAEIDISRCYSITDDGLWHLGNIRTPRRISVRVVPLSGSGLTHLRNCRSLAVLQLNETGVDDAGLQHLHGLNNLTRLELRQTLLTDAAVAFHWHSPRTKDAGRQADRDHRCWMATADQGLAALQNHALGLSSSWLVGT